MKNYFFLMLLLLCGAVANVNSQVSIGKDKVPENYSVLELISNGSNGLRLPQLTTSQRDAIVLSGQVLAEGLVIYNLDTKCVDYWNNSKWVNMCLGTANIILEGDPCGTYDYSNPPSALSDGTGTPCVYTPTSSPKCVVSTGQAYQVYLTLGEGYATLNVDAMTSAFSVTFQPNNSAKRRIAIVHVVNNCSGEFKDFVFMQEGATCPTGIAAFTLQQNSATICGENGAVIAWVTNPQSGIYYFWEFGGVVVKTGNYMEITHAGTYMVYAGLAGCDSPEHQTLTVNQTTGTAAVAPTLSVSNGGILCGSGNVILTAGNVTSSVVEWYHNGAKATNTGNPLTLSGASNAGEWFAVQSDGSGCGSRSSNIVTLTDQTGNIALPVPQATVNGTPLSGAITICKGGTLELKVTNSGDYPFGTLFEWFDGAVSLAPPSTDDVLYVVAPNTTQMTLSIQARNNSRGCPNTSTSGTISVNLTAPVAPTINNNSSSAAICSGTPAVLIADPSNADSYEWFVNGTPISSATTSTYSAAVQGTYTVRYKNTNGCWSQLSSAINVVQSATISLSWLVAPKAVAIIDSYETYSVLASPTPDSYTWTSSNDSLAIVIPIEGGRSAIVHYFEKLGNVTINVSAINTCGTVSLDKLVNINNGCMDLASVNLIPAGTITRQLTTNGVAYPGEEKTTFVATASGGGGVNPYMYEFFVGGVSQGQASTNNTFTYNTPSNAGDYAIAVKAYNCSSSNAMTSEVTTVRVLKNNPIDATGNYRLGGNKTCFDVKQGNDNTICGAFSSRTNDFASTFSYSYLFSNSASYSNLTYEIGGDNPSLATVTGNGTTVATVTFVSNIATLAENKDKNSALKLKLIAKFKDNNNNDKQVELLITVQDCSCGCSVRSTLPAGWLTFMCYNLGAKETMSIAEQIAYVPLGNTDATVYGNLYQWGRKSDGYESRSSSSITGGPVTIPDVNSGQVTGDAIGKFIVNSKSPYDWRNPQVTDPWYKYNAKTANDPCPAGWRVPTYAEWISIFNDRTSSFVITTSWKAIGSSNKVRRSNENTKGIEISADGINTALFLPSAGSRYTTNGMFYDVGLYGYYWSSTANGTSSHYFGFGNTIVIPGGNTLRGNGISVRCIAE